MSAPPRIRITLSPEAARYARRDAPVEARRMAAGGALPLAPPELAAVLFVLLHDPDEQVKGRARESLEGLPDSVLGAVLEGNAPPAVISYLARVHAESPERLERIALNPAADDETLAYLAGLPHRRLVELLSQNQERLLRCPELVDALGSNPLTGRAAIDRILSFLGYEGVEREGAADESAADAAGEPSDHDAEAALRALLGEDAAGLAAGLARDQELGEAERASLYHVVQGMNVLQKVKLARTGSKEARAILVRDPNKIVAGAAVRSPRLREDEVLAFAKSRNVCDEVLRALADNRDWTRSYPVKLALVSNPKCPQPKAMQFLNHLQERDLRQVARSKDVPAATAAHARRLLDRRGQRR